jgi:glycosyltransferase involved in cell wall biosynthesis
MNILLHVRASGGGGAERVFASLAVELARRGHGVTLAVDMLDGPVPPPAGVDTVILGRNHARAVRHLAALIRRGGYDVLAGAVSVSNVKLALAKVLAASRTPLVVSFHGFEEYKTGRLSALAYHGMPVLGLIASRIVCVSDALVRGMVEIWKANPAKTVRIYNPVPLPGIHLSAGELAARSPVIGALGRLSPEKGMADLVQAFARVTTPGARLVIGGAGPEEARLKQLIAGLGLTGRVELLGEVAGPVAVFAAAKVAAVPSRTEAFGMAAVEALGYGLPVVATDCDGLGELLAGGYGTLVPIGDAEAMARALDAALADPGDPGPRIAYAGRFSLAAGTDAWEALFAGLARPKMGG